MGNGTVFARYLLHGRYARKTMFGGLNIFSIFDQSTQLFEPYALTDVHTHVFFVKKSTAIIINPSVT
jgi:hypothetical protein